MLAFSQNEHQPGTITKERASFKQPALSCYDPESYRVLDNG
ncbi:MAG TPA: hypothetical protein VM821_01505 [Abditibacteriaceae bacterium]|nr:hypothetical protein [Abditibacteriaceae bacterium]